VNGQRAIFGAFLGCVAIITYREIKTPMEGVPLPGLPTPSRFVGAGVAFGMLGLVSEFLSEKIAAVLAIGLFIGLAFQTAQNSVNTKKNFHQGV
jgi:hypothetical protein